MGRGFEIASSTAVKKSRTSRNEATFRTSTGRIWVFASNMCNNPEFHARSNAFSKSKKDLYGGGTGVSDTLEQHGDVGQQRNWALTRRESGFFARLRDGNAPSGVSY
ncbi:hypothetical protein EVAR_76146_1 [Eumeta japonica]|uniref:Uncharacterized protein n=1 Tax=Eumeta variegata TaxID=151549 RepID=A0A4C1UVT3_EUMVA|nr:hypothetical protein EVAR_76146_1 [Eumeta japonica]